MSNKPNLFKISLKGEREILWNFLGAFWEISKLIWDKKKKRTPFTIWFEEVVKISKALTIELNRSLWNNTYLFNQSDSRRL